MTPTLKLAWQSLLNRKITALLTVLAIAISVTLLLGVEKIRTETKRSFLSTLSGTDLVIGARTGPVQLMLYSVFRMGNATNNIDWKSYQHLQQHPLVKWTIPLSLGDSHQGFRVLGTDQGYFTHYQYGDHQPLKIRQGKVFADIFDAVIGADVAKKLGYSVGESIVLAHGAGKTSFMKHSDKPFTVVGILAPTGTPVDQTIHVSLAGIEAIHLGWEKGVPAMGKPRVTAEQARQQKLEPKTITAALVGLKSKVATFRLQREINEYKDEPLTAVLPGVALAELWSLLSVAEHALLIISAFVVATGLIGMLTSILMSLNERRREMAILRSVGARPVHIFSLMMTEAGLLAAIGCTLGVSLLYLLMLITQPIISNYYGVALAITPLTHYEWLLILIIISSALLMGLIPAWRAYKNSLADGMTIRV